MKKKEEQPKYTFIIEKTKMRPLTWDETHGMEYIMNGKKQEGELVREVVWADEFEIKDEKVIDILKAVLKNNST